MHLKLFLRCFSSASRGDIRNLKAALLLLAVTDECYNVTLCVKVLFVQFFSHLAAFLGGGIVFSAASPAKSKSLRPIHRQVLSSDA